MIDKKKDIYDSWEEIPLPKNSGNFEVFQYLKTNLWILKNSKGGFGFLITDTISKLDSEYKNIVSDWRKNLKNKDGQILNRCLIIESKDNIDSKLFCSAISSLFGIINNKIFNINEIKEALRKIEDITLKESDEFIEAIGVWGEIYLINELIKNTKNDIGKLEIIESWEGVEARSKIDFNFKSKNIKIEVKTTTESIRIHHLNGLEQVSNEPKQEGYLASICVITDDSGLTCSDLVGDIKKSIPKLYLPILESKLELRGKVCRNSRYRFKINSSKQMEFFDFHEVPKPVTEAGIGKITWEATLENKQHIDGTKKHNLLNIMN